MGVNRYEEDRFQAGGPIESEALKKMGDTGFEPVTPSV